MPRLITRLLRHLENSPLINKTKRTTIVPIRPPRKTSLLRPRLPVPSLSAANRTQSILVDDVNPIVNADAYTRHKSLPPTLWPRRRAIRTRGEFDRPRSMTDEERGWWASPYLRMLSSPVRSCILTGRSLPSDFLVRLAPMRLPTPRTAKEAQSLVPDGIEHPKFKSRRSYIGIHVICCNTAIDHLADRGYYKRFSPNLSMHSRLKEHIGHVLRVRVLQELELLAEHLQANPQGVEDTTLIRKLTRAEWHSVRSTGIIPYENAVALVVVPPLNRNPVTKVRPAPSDRADSPAQDLPMEEGSLPSRSLPPISILHPVIEPSLHEDVLPDYLPSSKVPLYNGLSLFPSQPQRAALHARLSALLSVERQARYREHGRPGQVAAETETEAGDKWARGDKKASHAFLLCADEKTAKRADMAAVAIALWRVRIWEGVGWEDRGGVSDGWQLES